MNMIALNAIILRRDMLHQIEWEEWGAVGSQPKVIATLRKMSFAERLPILATAKLGRHPELWLGKCLLRAAQQRPAAVRSQNKHLAIPE